MKISMIVAMAHNRVIGLDNQMPWHLPADLQYFKKTTLGKPVIMGRKTYDSIGRALPGRLNIVVSRDPNLTISGVTCVTSVEQALAMAEGTEEVMIIGGATIYEYFLKVANRLYLTFIDLETKGDTKFPDYLAQGEWQQVASEEYLADEKNAYNLEFVTLDRVTD
ncbi:type 3 dihydrofolate reductase [Psychromonas sp. RZ22]|uniref:type 3 dihydrofolate reductase n=1 Tax=Psychromonas algarum TaxID=2555643 RepID=UPI001067FE15|nr:type 3 dihydrofolate reductase [Psychromonas sp. RZ22]TEW54409.1 type 3 dihydrofolate reductase [Psychromonas sp. RZ22]